MTTPIPGARPPIAAHTAPAPGTGAVRPTARVRPHLRVRLVPGPRGGLPVHDPYIRTFWVAAIGPGAVADLLRVIGCGRRRVPIKRPIFLHQLVRHGLVTVVDGVIVVREAVPPVPPEIVRTLTPPLRAAHREWETERASAG